MIIWLIFGLLLFSFTMILSPIFALIEMVTGETCLTNWIDAWIKLIKEHKSVESDELSIKSKLAFDSFKVVLAQAMKRRKA